jgi:hypothetical protein
LPYKRKSQCAQDQKMKGNFSAWLYADGGQLFFAQTARHFSLEPLCRAVLASATESFAAVYFSVI